MEMEKSKVLIKFLLNFRQSGDVLFFLYARRLRGYTATPTTQYCYSGLTRALSAMDEGLVEKQENGNQHERK